MSAPTIRELEAMLKAIGWKLTKIAEPNKTTGRYVAKGKGPAGQDGERDGNTPERALANLLTFAQHHNAIRAYSSLGQKIAMWQTPWEHQLEEIGHEYGQLPVYDPKAIPAWHALGNESRMQADHVRRQLNVRETDDPEPYPHHAAMLHDIHHNQNYVVSRAHTDHPVWTPDDLVNFRIVHDVLGHAQSGGDFGWQGENRACGIHFPMVSPLARRALFTECMGQTAYALRKGSHGFGPQKVGLMPQFLDSVEEMNGEHVHVPSGKLLYPEHVMPVEQATAWGWYQDPATGQWKQQQGATDTSEPAGVGQQQGVAASRNFRTSAGISSPGLPTHVGPHSMTPQEYPDRPEYRSMDMQGNVLDATIDHPGDDPLILPETAIDPNHYDHSLSVAPLTAAGAPNDYLDKQGTIDNAGSLTTDWIKEPHDRQVLAIRNACMAAIISPRKPLMWNAAHYQTLMNVPVGAPLGDFYLAWVKGREAHNYRMGHQETAFNIPWHGEGDWRPQAKLLQQHYQQFEGLDDQQSWRAAKDYLAKLYSHFEPYALAHVQRENEMRQQGITFDEGEQRPLGPDDKKRKQQDENEIRMHMATSTMVADFLKQQFAQTGAPEGALPGTDLLSRPADLNEWNELLPRAANFMPNDPRSPHGGYANSDDVVCNHCTQRTRSDKGKCEKCGQPLTGDEHPIIAGDADHDLRLQHSDWMDTTFGPGQHHDTYTGHVAAVPHRPTNKMAGFVYKHMEKLPELTNEVCEQLLAYAKKDMDEDNGRGYIWRAGVHALGVPGLDNKTASYAWLMLAPHTSELGIIDTHAARSMGFHDNDIEGNGGANYYAMERMQRHMKDSTGYGDIPLGMYHWGHWDMARSPGFHSDHRGLRPLDPLEYDDPDIDYGHANVADRKDTPIYIGPHEFMSQLQPGHAAANQWLLQQGLQPLPEPMNLDANNVSMQPDDQALGMGAPADVRAAGWVEKVEKKASWEEDAEKLKSEIPVEDYVTEAGGNTTQAIKALHEDLTQSHGYDPMVAWMIARSLVEGHENGQNPGSTDMSGFEEMMQPHNLTDNADVVPAGSDWGPTDEHPEDFNPAQQQAPEFQANQAVTLWDGRKGTVTGVEAEHGSNTFYTVALDGGNKITVRGDKMQPQDGAAKFSPEGLDQLPTFPEPTGDTVPDTMPSDWS